MLDGQVGHRVQRVGDRVQVPLRQMQVDHGVFEFDVTEEQLDRAQVRTGLQEVGRVRMPQEVR